MVINRPFAYNPTHISVTGTYNIGDLSVGVTEQNYNTKPGGLTWWGGPDEKQGYVIAVPIPGNTQPTPLFSGAPSEYLTLSSTYKGAEMTLSNGNQTIQQLFGYEQSILGNTLIDFRSKVMFSVSLLLIEPLTLPGSHFIGVGYNSMNYQGNPYGGYPGNDNQSVGVSSAGSIWYDGNEMDSGFPTFTDGDIIDIAMNGNLSKVWIRVNGGDWNNNPSNNPATDDGGYSVPIAINGIYPVLCPGYEGTMTIQNTASYGVPSGFTLLGVNAKASVKFLGTKVYPSPLTETTFILLTNQYFNQSFTAGSDASIWLTTNGYWNSYDSIVLYLDAGNILSYPTTGTNWYDLSIKDYTGTLINGASFNSNNGGSIVFDGTNDGVSIVMPTPTSIKNSLSFDFWLLSTGQTATLQSILSKGLPNDVTAGYIRIYRQTSTDDLRYSYANGSAHLQTNIPNFFNGYNNTWLNLQITFNYSSGSFNVYRNGVLFFNTTITNSPLFPTKSGTAYIGLSSTGSGSAFNGKISVVKIYNKELTSTDVTQNFDSIKSRYL